MASVYFLCLMLVFAGTCLKTKAFRPVHVSTPLGKIIGNQKAKVNVFLGIPYAKPPERFRDPIHPDKFEGDYVADSLKPMCKKNPCNDRLFCINSTSEDCLYLNIFTPINACSTNHPKAVMVYIHGGSFVRGTGLAPVNFGNTLAEKGDVIVVTINYRLGIFGWLATGKYSVSDLHGNYGLKDQQMALKWVNENIKAFGGNPDKVTIFGDGDGAESVGIHMTNNRSEDFFSSSIMMSASFTIPFKTYYSALFQTHVIDQILGCSIHSLDVMITCLRANADSDDLLRAQNFFLSERIKIGPSEFVNAIEPIGSVIDYDWVPATLVDAFKEARQKISKPVMLGSVREEGVRFLLGQNKDAVSYVKVQGKVRGALVNRVDPAPTAQELVTNYPLSCVNSTFLTLEKYLHKSQLIFSLLAPQGK